MLLDSRLWNIKCYDTTGSSVTIEFSIIGLSRSQLPSKSCIHLALPSYISNYPTGKWVSSTIYIPNTALYLAECSGVQHTNNTQRHSDMSVVHFVMLECFCLRLPNRHPVFEEHVTTLSISDKNNWSLLMSLLYPRTIHLFLCLHLLAVLSINPTHSLSLSTMVFWWASFNELQQLS